MKILKLQVRNFNRILKREGIEVKIKIIFFDIGDVVCKLSTKRLQRISKWLNIPFDPIRIKVAIDKAGNLISDKGSSRIEFLRTLAVILTGEVKDPPLELMEPYYDEEDLSPVPEVKEIILELVAHNFRVGIISNSSPQGYKKLQEKEILDYPWDIVVFSHLVGVRKPDKRIYHIALKQAQVKPEEALLIDDLPINIISAMEIGMEGIVYINPSQLRYILSQKGIL